MAVVTEQDKLALRNAEQLKVLMAMPGWTDIVQPILDKMIEDCIGYKRGGEWFGGLIHKNDGNELSRCYYTQALIEFQNRINDHIRIAERLKSEEQTRQSKNILYTNPMVDTRYST